MTVVFIFPRSRVTRPDFRQVRSLTGYSVTAVCLAETSGREYNLFDLHQSCGQFTIDIMRRYIMLLSILFDISLVSAKVIVMSKSYKGTMSNISRHMAKLRIDIPETMKGFSAMAAAATAPGALDAKTKELIALALGVAAHCDGCIGFHVKALIRAGATRAEIAEALGMAIYLGGGPSVMYAAEALGAYEELTSTDAAQATAA